MTTRNSALITTAAAIALAAAGAANAAIVTSQIEITVENEPVPPSFYKSVLLFPVDQQGEPMPSVTFDTAVDPVVLVGDETSDIVRTIQSFSFINDFGDPGDEILRIVFHDDSAWAPGEMLTFVFKVIHDENERFKFDLQLTLLPAPGAAGLFGLAGLVAARRSRRRA